MQLAAMVMATCPADEALARVAAGEAPEVERAAVMAHLDSCARCRRGLALLAALPPTPADSFLGGEHTRTVPDQPSTVTTPRVPLRSRPAGAGPTIPALGDRIGRYVALRVIGRGGMGIVVAAHDPELDRQVAIKLVHPRLWRAATASARDLLRLEARAMARLVHPNVVTVHDLGTVDDQLFVAMELVTGSSLDRWLSARPRQARDVLAMCCEAGQGIAAAHRAGLVHRDIKPHNVLVDDRERPRIADFGLAVLGRADARDDDTAPAGTPAYMSPEQHRGATVSAASDQFSFCVMVYEALYGERPFAGETTAAICLQIERGELRPAPDGSRVPSRIRRVLLRGLSTEVADRFPNMDALLTALAPPPRSRWKLRVAAVALAAAAAAAAAMFVTRDRAEPATAARHAAEARAAAIWSPAARQAVDATLAAGAAAHAAATRTRVPAAIDAYLARWVAARLAVTRTARAAEEVPVAAERRLACLDRRLGEVRALVAVLSAGGPGVAAKAVDGVAALTPAQVCIDRDVMALRPPPEEPRRRARHDELSRALDDIAALDRVGRQQDAAAAAAAVMTEVRAFDHPPLLAEALILHARVLTRVGEMDLALATYREVMPVAAAAGDTELEARAWIELTTTTINAGRGKPGDDIVVAAGAAAARAAAAPRIQLSYQLALAAVAMSAGRHADAEAIYRRLLAAAPPDDPVRGRLLFGLGTALGEQQRWEDALLVQRAALTLAETHYGPDHPDLARSWSNLEAVLFNMGRFDEALEAAHKVSALAEPGTVTAGLAILYEGSALRALGRDQEALTLYQQAAQIFHAGGNRRQEFEALMNLGAAHLHLDQLTDADAALVRALELGKVMFAEQPTQLALVTILRGEVALERGDLTNAIALCTEAVELAAHGGEDHPDLLNALPCLSSALRLSGRPADALVHAERAVRNADRNKVTTGSHNARLELLRTLAALGRDRPRRRTLLRDVLALEPDVARRAPLEQEFRADLR